MKIKFFCTKWGSEALAFDAFLEKAKLAGYDGVEMNLPLDNEQKEAILGALESYSMPWIGQHWETMTADFEEHKQQFSDVLVNLATSKPLFIHSQTGKDFFSFEQNAELIQLADDISKKYGIKIIHETHRGKFNFAPHITHHFLQQIPTLRLGLDISHWVNVAESWLEDQIAATKLAFERVDHIHARVGFPEGPQIPDPRELEWQEALTKHVNWWKQIIALRQLEGLEYLTITPEFGPYPYMTMLPTSKLPITNQWDVNVFMKNYLKEALL